MMGYSQRRGIPNSEMFPIPNSGLFPTEGHLVTCIPNRRVFTRAECTNQRISRLTFSSSTAAFLSISGSFSAAGGLAAGGLSAGAGGGGEWDEADEAANDGIEGSIGLDAEGSLNERLSTDACNKDVHTF